jgi:hypothetical protein
MSKRKRYLLHQNRVKNWPEINKNREPQKSPGWFLARNTKATAQKQSVLFYQE